MRIFFYFFIYVVKAEGTNFSNKNKTSAMKYDTTVTNKRHPPTIKGDANRIRSLIRSLYRNLGFLTSKYKINLPSIIIILDSASSVT